MTDESTHAAGSASTLRLLGWGKNGSGKVEGDVVVGSEAGWERDEGARMRCCVYWRLRNACATFLSRELAVHLKAKLCSLISSDPAGM